MSTETITIEGFPLSPQQSRVWALQQAGRDATYRARCAVMAEGDVAPASLKEALEEVVRRHEILRTTFRRLPGVEIPLQVIEDGSVCWADDRDLSGAAPATQERELDELLRQTSPCGCADSGTGPTLHARVVTLSPRRHALLLSLPALCADAATLKNIVRELGLGIAPAAERDGEVLQYADFAEWQNEVAAGEEAKSEGELRDVFKVLEGPAAKLPFEFEGAGKAGFEPDSVAFELAAPFAQRIVARAQERGGDAPTFLLACWQTLLWRLSGESDLLLGVGYDGRKYEELRGALGLFAKYLPLRIRMGGESRFSDVLAAAESAWRHGYQNQEYFNWEKTFKTNGGPAALPFFDFCFDFEEHAEGHASAGDIALSLHRHYVCIERFKLKLSCTRRAGAFVAQVHYDSGLFRAPDIERLVERFRCLVESAADTPDAPVSDLNLLPAAERRQLLHDFNDTASDYDRGARVHELFEQQAERTPAAVALVSGGEELTYAELNSRANRLAHYLRARGVRADTPVGLCCERSIEMVVAILGTLKAGGCYVPLDPEYPRERLAFMLSDSGINFLLTQQRLLGRLPEHAAEAVSLDADWEEIAQSPDTDLADTPDPEGLAYVIYTSGSTGRPKGVMIPHRALHNHMAWMLARFPLTAEDAVIQKTPFSFDASVWEFYAPLLSGARLVMAEPGGHYDPEYLVQVMREQGVTTLQLVPSLLERLLEEKGLERCVNLRRVFCGGEALPARLVGRFFERLSAEFYNLYGPTEATIDATCWECEPGRKTVPIGAPVSNTQVYVLDQRMRVAPIGVVGELYLGGESLGRGYLNRPGLTAERFVPHPFSSQPGARLYRTGDVVRWNEEGELEYLGRNDEQVKLRGYRIEVGEIEAALLEREEVGQAVVLVREDEGRGKQLAAFVCPANGVAPDSKELREYLQGRLPEYMVPASLAVLEQMPLTPNGKVNRKALLLAGAGGSAFEGARDEVEGLLAQVWAEVLGVERVGVHDSFFELGGHSLLATQLISRIQALFQIELPIRTLFSAPVLADLAREVEGILKGGKTIESLPLRPLPRNRDLPLSFAQERLWFLDQLEPSNPFYNISTAVRIAGRLDVGALERALGEIVRRHESLRTTFTFDERPRQQITPEGETSLPVIDLRGDPAEEQQPKVSALADEEAQRPFDLSGGPLLRTTLLRLAEEESVLLLTMHHVVSDGWSLGILIREITALYEAFSKGRPSPLPDLPIQYADFAVWQRSWLQGSVFSRQLKYWKEQLAGLPPTLELPTDHPRPEVQKFRGAVESSVLPRSLADELRAVCRSEGVTLYMLMLAAFQVLLYRYTGQTDIAVGSPIANRNRKEVEGLIGFFINTLVMRTDLSGEPSFRQVLKRVREVTLGAYAHQDLPFEKLVEELKPVRDLSRQPLFQVMLAFQNTPTTKLEVAGLNFTGLEVNKKTVQFDWNVAMQEIDEGIILEWHYNTDLFEAETIRRMLGHLRHLLESVAARPEQPVSDLNLLPAAERRQLLHDFNDTASDYDRGARVHTLFEQQAERTPAAVALVSGGEQVTYAELNSRANRLAHYLRARGVRADTPVGLCLERSAEMVVAMLGVLKAGGAYVPLDPEYPRERLAFMLADCGARLLLTQRRASEGLPQHAAEEVRLDADWPEIAQSPDTKPEEAAEPENLAYVIYTSGSTGRPKGVMIPHRALHNHMAWMLARFPLTAEDAVIQKTPFSFDASVWEFYAPLLSGGRLVMAEPGGHYDPGYLVRLIAGQGVTTLQVVPSLLERLLEEPELERCGLRRVFCGGEALAARLVDLFFERVGAELYNLYGPTEATIDATSWECAPSSGRRSIPIGAPISNTQVYVLDARMRLLPAGVSGELYLGGEGLGRGYRGRPDLTAERFVPDPFSSEPGARLYRTGDIVRWDGAGELEYLGRNDQQVKVRGYRIEVGEIEAALLEREEVGQAVVLVREDGRGKQLAAFVVPKGGEDVDANELRGHLQGRLPDYMAPASIAVLEQMPLTPNGKIDRQALLSVKAEPAERTSGYAGARNGVEEVLAQVWQEVLGVKRVGIHDNFFELGGESILSIQVIARLRQEGLKLTLKQMFQHQTIAELARVVVSVKEANAEQFDAGDSVPLTPIQHRFFELALPNPHHFNQAVMLAADSRPDAAALEAVLQKLVEHHAGLRLRFASGEGGRRQSYAEAEAHHLVRSIDLSHLAEDGDEQRRQLEAQAEAAQSSLDLAEGPLLRAVLFELGGGRGSRLLLVIHHLAVDGVSWRVLLEDLQTGYEQALQGQQIELPPPTASFRRWARALQDYGSSERLRAEVGYWTDARRREVGRLPVDFAGGENTVSSAQSVEFELGPEETRALLQEVPRAYHTQAQEALAAALVVAFKGWTGEPALLVDFEGHGREEEAAEGLDVSRTVGWFTSVYPVLLEAGGGEVAPTLKAVKEQLRGVPQRGVGYGVLRYLSGDAGVSEALASLPAAEVSFNYLGQFDRVLDEGGRFRAAAESAGAVQDAAGRREHLLAVNALVAGGRLRVSFGYSEAAHRRETVEGLAAGFAEALRELIAHCREEGAGGHTPSDFPLARLTQQQVEMIEAGQAGVEDIYALSPLQQGLMFHSLYAPHSGLYVAQSSVRMRKLDREAFQRAWQRVVDRHEILRTAFVADGLDKPVQVVLGDVPLSWHEQDLRGLSEAAAGQKIDEYVEWDLAQGYDFARAPVMRLALLRTDEDDYQFVWSHHHVLLDGWSIPLLVKEVASFYEADSRGEGLELPKPRPYRDYMAWLARQDERAAEEFWRAELRGVSGPTRLGIDRGAEAGVEEYGEQQVGLGEELTTRLREIGRRNQVTLNTIIQGAWALLLSRYSGESRVTFGTTVAGRPAELDGVGRMVGLFVNTVPLSFEVDEGEPVISYLKQIQQKHVEIRQHEHTPLVKIQGWSDAPRGVPLYENLFTFQNYPVDDRLWEQGAPQGLQVESVRTRAKSHYPLAVRIAAEASMLIRMTYDRGRYSDASVRRMLGHLQCLLEEMGSDPSRRLSGLELLTPEERRVMLTGGGDASAQTA